TARVMTVKGNYTQADIATLELDLSGDGGVAGTDFDRLQVNGVATLEGTAEVTVTTGYVPAAGTFFDALIADTVTIGPGFAVTSANGFDFGWQIIDDTTLRLTVLDYLSGDANDDNVVDVADLGILADNFRNSVTGGLDDGDFNNDG